jgi:transcriptional regulator with XRE-family HTH domain
MNSYTADDDFTWLEVGERIKRMRVAAGMTQAKLAEKAGLTQGGIFAIERGDTNPQLSSLRVIARTFGVTVREIVCGVEAKRDSAADKAARLLGQVFESVDPLAIDVVLSGLRNGIRIAQYHANANRRPDWDCQMDDPTLRLLQSLEDAVRPPIGKLTRDAAPRYQDLHIGQQVGQSKRPARKAKQKGE